MPRTRHHVYYTYNQDDGEIVIRAVWSAPKGPGPKLQVTLARCSTALVQRPRSTPSPSSPDGVVVADGPRVARALRGRYGALDAPNPQG